MDTKEKILAKATKLSESKGYHAITRQEIAEAAGCAAGMINKHYGTMADLQKEVVRNALLNLNMRILGQALAMKHPLVRRAPKELRSQVAQAMV